LIKQKAKMFLFLHANHKNNCLITISKHNPCRRKKIDKFSPGPTENTPFVPTRILLFGFPHEKKKIQKLNLTP